MASLQATGYAECARVTLPKNLLLIFFLLVSKFKMCKQLSVTKFLVKFTKVTTLLKI